MVFRLFERITRPNHDEAQAGEVTCSLWQAQSARLTPEEAQNTNSNGWYIAMA